MQAIRSANAAEASAVYSLYQARIYVLQTVVGALTLLAAGAAAVFTKLAADEAARGVAVAISAAGASEASAKAALKSASLTEANERGLVIVAEPLLSDFNVIQMRVAYLEANARGEQAPLIDARIIFKLSNIGRGIALVQSLRGRLAVAGSLPVQVDLGPELPFDGRWNIAPGPATGLKRAIQLTKGSVPLDRTTFEALVAADKFFFFTCGVTYLDLSGQDHFTTVAYRYDITQSWWEPVGGLAYWIQT